MAGIIAHYRRAFLGVLVFGVWYFLFYGIDPAGVRSSLAQGIFLAAALLLLIGILPRSYLQCLADKFAARERAAPSWVVFIPGMMVPAAFLLPAVAVGLEAASILASSLRLPSDVVRFTKWDPVFSVGSAVIGLGLLTINLATVLRSRRAKE